MISASFAGGWGEGTPLTNVSNLHHSKSTVINVINSLVHGEAIAFITGTREQYRTDMKYVQSGTRINLYSQLRVTDVKVKLNHSDFIDLSMQFNSVNKRFINTPQSDSKMIHSVLPAVDTITRERYNAVKLYQDKTVNPLYNYYPNSNFTLSAESNKFSAMFTEPDSIPKTVMSPVTCGSKLKLKPSKKPLTFIKPLTYGYSLNRFVVGGLTLIGNKIDPDATIPPKEPIIHENYEVYHIVNVINMYVLPERTSIQFENFTLSRDIDSFVWSASFTVFTQADYDLIKPVGRNIKTIEIDINGTKIKLFVGSTSTSISSSKDGKVSKRYEMKSWSSLKLLAFPYHRKRSFTELTNRTAAQLATIELDGTGQALTWDTVDWTIPAGIFSYQDKTPLGAILDLCATVGAVIVPALNTDEFTVKPYYPVSPWLWNDLATVPDRIMSENQFFSIDTDTVPKDNPNAVYVYGEEGGIGVKVTRAGTAGDEMLPDVVDKYITDPNAGRERGRIEVSKSSFIDVVTMTTYVDENGLIIPQELISFGDWVGMVTGVSLRCNRVGMALLQTITVAKYYE